MCECGDVRPVPREPPRFNDTNLSRGRGPEPQSQTRVVLIPENRIHRGSKTYVFLEYNVYFKVPYRNKVKS